MHSGLIVTLMVRFYIAPLVLSLLQAGHLLGQRLNESTAVQMHPSLTWLQCAPGGSCSVVNASITETNAMCWFDWFGNDGIHCWEDHVWNGTICPNVKECYNNCEAHPVTDYAKLFGITTSTDAVTMRFFTQSSVVNIGNSVLLLDPTSTQAAPTNKYQIFFPLNMELSFDVDVSQLPCGLASSLSFKEISADGGISADPLNKVGAGWGTGNCDGRCSTDRQFIHGLPNVGNMLGACCNEFRLWHGNAVSETMVAHPCSAPGLTTCTAASSGGQCATPSCDVTGCSFNPFREGTPASFYGVGPTFAIDTSRKFTVVTQFIIDSNSAAGELTSIRRFYIQGGTTIPNPSPGIAGITPTDEFADKHCAEQKLAFGESNVFANLGGLATLGSAFQRGMVLEMSIDEDRVDHMLWLDSTFPPGADPQLPGVIRGLCGTDTGAPVDVEANDRGAQVVFSNIKFGPIGSTVPLAGVPNFGQCGGTGYTGSTTCVEGSICTVINPFFSQCLPGGGGGGTTFTTTTTVSTSRPASSSTASAPIASQTPAAVNPYTGYNVYLTPFYGAEVAAAAANISNATTKVKAMSVAEIPTFIWFDQVAKVPDLGTYLADARNQAQSSFKPMLVQIIVYDLPDRDCAAAASNGEFSIANNGQANYFNYIDRIVAQIKPFPEVRVVAIIEPDSLANLVTNLSVEKCANAATTYLACVTYAIQQLNTLGNVYSYLDAGHAGSLGWPANISSAARLFSSVYKEAGSPSFVRGLATNVANYNALVAATPDPITQGNPNYDESHYISAFTPLLTSSGFPAHFIVDQGRSGVQNIRQHWGDWCNVKGAGFGMHPTINTGNSAIDAIVWAKPGGECDGTSNPSSARFDFHCVLPDADQPAPEAGTWFQEYFMTLVTNANPAL